MIDIKAIRENPTLLTQRVAKKDPQFPLDKLFELDKQVRTLLVEVEELRHTRNEYAHKGQQGVTAELREKSIALAKTLKEKEAALALQQEQLRLLMLTCPNVVEDDVPAGGKEANQPLRYWGDKPQFSFQPRHHVALVEQHDWVDFAAAARMSGAQFALYKGELVRVMYALMLMMFSHNRKQGYQPILPPYLVNEQSLYGAGNFPKFVDDVYAVSGDQLYLTPTAEVNLTNLYRDHIFSAGELPLRFTAWTSCFRREAGGYGATERGMIRMHQFEKVELYAMTTPEQARDEHEKMLACAEGILQKLGLHYRVSLLAAQDCSFPSAKTYDIELWLPGQNEYKEVASVSTCSDFQARRCALRYREQAGSKTQLVHTLNGSSLALPRLLVVLLETYQQADGSIAWPAVISAYLDLI
jgi:seryl-tRNA synthetase